jgi:hypothetical protein
MARITEEQAAAVRAEIAAGMLSARKIAAAVGISAGSVRLIARGAWRPHIEGRKKVVVLYNSPTKLDNVKRCATCGLLVTLPCLKCKVGRNHPTVPPLKFFNVGRDKPIQANMDEVCGHCGSGPEKITGRGLVCSACESPWKPFPSLEKIRERAREELRNRQVLE